MRAAATCSFGGTDVCKWMRARVEVGELIGDSFEMGKSRFRIADVMCSMKLSHYSKGSKGHRTDRSKAARTREA